MTANYMIITGGDETYATLIEELVQSIRDKPQGKEVEIGVLDGGLSAEAVHRFESDYRCHMITPPWEYELPKRRVRGREYLRVELAKAFLDRYFPDPEVLLWIDADAWVQDWHAIDWLTKSAQLGNLAIVSQVSRLSDQVVRVRWNWLRQPVVKGILYKNAKRAGLPRLIQRQLAARPTLNAGVYALRQDAPHWEHWRTHQARVLPKGRIFTASQLAIGLMTYVDRLPHTPLPVTCNYMGPWRFDEQRRHFVEYHFPYRKCGIIHMAGEDEMRRNPDHRVEVPDLEGRMHSLSLRYAHWRQVEKKTDA